MENEAQRRFLMDLGVPVGQGFLFSLYASPDFKDSGNVIAYVGQGGLGLPDTTYYTDAKKADKLKAYQAHVAKVLELSGVAAADAALAPSR